MSKKAIINVSLFAILLLSFAIRYKGITFGFPLIVHPDEPKIVTPAFNMLQSGDLNPHTFLYPSLYIYLQAFVYALLMFSGKILGTATSINELEITSIYYWGRMLTILFSTGTIYLTYLVASTIFDRKLAIISTFFIATSTLHIFNSYLITTDSPMAFWITASLLMSSLHYAKGPKSAYYILNGIFIGFAIGTKYTAVFCVLPLIFVHLFHDSFSISKVFDKRFILGLLLIPISFILTTPYLVIDFKTFLGYIQFQQNAYSQGHAGAESNLTSYSFYFQSLLQQYGQIPLILSGIGFILALVKDFKKALFLGSFPFIYFIFLGSYKVHFDRNIVCLLPFLAISSGAGIYSLAAYSARLVPHNLFKYTMYFLLGSLLLTGGYQQTKSALNHIHAITLPDTRWIAKLWIENNIPPGSRIGREHYTPPVDPKQFQVSYLGMIGLIRSNLWSFDFVIASSGDYDRFMKDEKRYPAEAQTYKQIFSTYKLIKEFAPDKDMSGPIIRLYKVR